MDVFFCRIRANIPLVFVICLLMAGRAVAQSQGCDDPDFVCYFKRAKEVVNGAEWWVDWWIKAHLVLKLIIVALGILATVMFALTDEKTKNWAKPIGLSASAIVTGLTAGIGTFQIPENIEKLAENARTLKQITNDFDFAKVKLVKGATQEEINKRFGTDPGFRAEVNKLTYDYVNAMNNVEVDMLRVIGLTSKPKAGETIPKPVTDETGTGITAKPRTK